MCGRFTLRQTPTWHEYSNALRIINPYPESDFQPSFNIAPGTTKPLAARWTEAGHELVHMKWGFRPAWMTDEAIKKARAAKRGGGPSINARTESIFKKPRSMWSGAALKKRLLIFADGFYEPEGPKTVKNRPWWFFQLPNGEPFAFGGLWTGRVNEKTDEWEESFAIITTPAPDYMKPIHNRHPLMLGMEHWATWLDAETHNTQEAVAAMINTYDGPALEHWRVSDRAKSPKNNDADCCLPLVA